MLVLSRKLNEDVIFTVPPSATPTEVRVKVVSIGRGKIRLGCTAPKDVRIYREETLPQEGVLTNDEVLDEIERLQRTALLLAAQGPPNATNTHLDGCE
jgi:carbon storage regulator CsrA